MDLPVLKAISRALVTSSLLVLAGSLLNAQSTTNLRLMAVGDSITAGYQSSTGNGYRGPLYTQLASQVATQDFVGTQYQGSMLDPDHEGHYGWRIDQISGIIDNSLASYKPNVVLLLIGINDYGQNYQTSTVPNRLASLIDQIHKDEPDAAILVSQLIVNSNSNTESEVNTYNNALPGIISTRANAGVHIAEVNMSALNTSDLADGLHPNDSGYAKMATAFDNSILQAISNGWVGDPVPGSITHPPGYVYSGLSGKCLDDFQASSTAGAKAVIWDCASSSSQWDYNNNQLIIHGLCLDIVGGNTTPGTLVDLWGCTESAANQTWTIQSNGSIRNPASGLCLDVPGGNTTNGTQLEIWTCNGGTNQQWVVPGEGPVASGIGGKCIDLPGGQTTNGIKAEIYTCNNTVAQQWKVFNDTVQHDGKCLDIVGGSTASGALVDLWPCNGQPNQVWVPENGALVNPASGLCLDDPGFSTTDGTQLSIYACNGGANQKWSIPLQ